MALSDKVRTGGLFSRSLNRNERSVTGAALDIMGADRPALCDQVDPITFLCHTTTWMSHLAPTCSVHDCV